VIIPSYPTMADQVKTLEQMEKKLRFCMLLNLLILKQPSDKIVLFDDNEPQFVSLLLRKAEQIMLSQFVPY
jgi:hypothetical protein